MKINLLLAGLVPVEVLIGCWLALYAPVLVQSGLAAFAGQ